MNSTLSHDLMVEILLRLPVKSLLRFKCVCKSWLSLISDPHFAKSHFDLAAAPTYRILHKSDYSSSIQSMDIEASFHNDSAVLNLSIPHPCKSFANNFLVLGCCRGFIFFKNEGNFMLWNPTTGVHKHIPYHVERMFTFLEGFGYDVSTDDYLIIVKAYQLNSSMQICGTCFVLFSLKTNSWSKLEGVNFPEVDAGFRSTSTGSYLNGALHWLALSNNEHFDAIIAFDLKDRKKLTEIPMPHDLAMEGKNNKIRLKLTVMKGCLCLCYNSPDNEMVEIWMMKEYKVESSWTKSIVLSTCGISGNFFFPMGFTKGGEIIGSTECGGLAKFNDQGELLEHRKYERAFSLVYLRSVVYRESLLSHPSN